MARMNLQKVRGSWQCQVLVERWSEQEPCGKPKRSHSDKVKRGVTDHPYGGEDGTLIALVLPKCGGPCGRELQPGEEYRLWAPRYGPKRIRCMVCPAPSRASMTGSEILSMAWDIADDDISAEGLESIDDFESLRDDFAQRIQEVVDLIQEKLDNIESGTGHTGLPVYEELDERRGMYEDWQQEVEALDFSQFEEASEACANCSLAASDHYQNDDDHEFEEGESELDVESALEHLQEAIGNCPE